MSDLAVEIELPEPEAETEEPRVAVERDRDLLGRRNPNAPIRKKLTEIWHEVARGFEAQSERSNNQQDYWDGYNCKLNRLQNYDGNSQICLTYIYNAVNARATRFVNQMFPQAGRAVEAVDSDGSTASALVAMLDHYYRKAKFKTQVLKPLCRNGDIEGQYNLYVDWCELSRVIVSRETHGPIDPETGQEMPGEEILDIAEEEVVEGRPTFEVLHDCDVLVLPASADSIEEALHEGGSVTVVRRWSKTKIKEMREAGAIRKDEADDLIETMGKPIEDQPDEVKKLIEHVGIRKEGREATVWETWAMLPVGPKGYDEDGSPRLCRIFLGPAMALLGAKRNPYWNDLCPLLSAPVQKIAGSFKGNSMVQPAMDLLYEANDAVNEGADAAAYSALPIVVRDPEKMNGPMILNLAAIWDAAPDSVKFMTFPDLTPRAMMRAQYCVALIYETLGVNPAMLPQQSGKPGAKRNQAEIALEQSVDLLTTAEAVSVIEETICTPSAGWAVDLDYQFRDREISVRMFGEMGHEAVMQQVAPLQNRAGFTFIWRGGDQVRQNAMMMQQGTGWLNVLRSLRQDLAAEGISLRLGPLIEAGTKNIFGPILGAKVIVDQRDQLTIDPETENEMLLDGFEVSPHPLDDDAAHIKAHMQAIQQMGDPHGTLRVHLQMQLKQAQGKMQAAMIQKMQQALQQSGGQPGAPPGAAGPSAPQPGATPAGPRLVKGPPGTVSPDRFPQGGAVGMPRRV